MHDVLSIFGPQLWKMLVATKPVDPELPITSTFQFHSDFY
jgi:hypothetical protein